MAGGQRRFYRPEATIADEMEAGVWLVALIAVSPVGDISQELAIVEALMLTEEETGESGGP